MNGIYADNDLITNIVIPETQIPASSSETVIPYCSPLNEEQNIEFECEKTFSATENIVV